MHFSLLKTSSCDFAGVHHDTHQCISLQAWLRLWIASPLIMSRLLLVSTPPKSYGPSCGKRKLKSAGATHLCQTLNNYMEGRKQQQTPENKGNLNYCSCKEGREECGDLTNYIFLFMLFQQFQYLSNRSKECNFTTFNLIIHYLSTNIMQKIQILALVTLQRKKIKTHYASDTGKSIPL